jgi:hypothetical protein
MALAARPACLQEQAVPLAGPPGVVLTSLDEGLADGHDLLLATSLIRDRRLALAPRVCVTMAVSYGFMTVSFSS